MGTRRFYEVIQEWGDTGGEPSEHPYDEDGLRAATDEYHRLHGDGHNASVWLVYLDEASGERDETVVLGPKPDAG